LEFSEAIPEKNKCRNVAFFGGCGDDFIRTGKKARREASGAFQTDAKYCEMEITAESIGDRCHWVGFRILYIKADRRQPERATILWRGFPDGEKPPI
jgi:hypothetical protein